MAYRMSQSYEVKMKTFGTPLVSKRGWTGGGVREYGDRWCGIGGRGGGIGGRGGGGRGGGKRSK